MWIIVYAVHDTYKSLLAMFVVLTTRRGENVKMVQQVKLGIADSMSNGGSRSNAKATCAGDSKREQLALTA